MNLTELLAALSNLDEAAEVEFDPLLVVGELRDKVDAIYNVAGRLGAESARLKADSDRLATAARDFDRQRTRLMDYVSFAMRTQGFTKLPGKVWRIQFQKAAPSLKVEREPTADDLLENPTLVDRKVIYSWKKDEIKQLVASGGKFRHGQVVQGEYLKFHVNKEGGHGKTRSKEKDAGTATASDAGPYKADG